jgi:hypothetical protein
MQSHLTISSKTEEPSLHHIITRVINTPKYRQKHPVYHTLFISARGIHALLTYPGKKVFSAPKDAYDASAATQTTFGGSSAVRTV